MADTRIADHKFIGRRFPQAHPQHDSTEPCGQSCARCGHQWYEHEECETDERTLNAISLAARNFNRMIGTPPSPMVFLMLAYAGV